MDTNETITESLESQADVSIDKILENRLNAAVLFTEEELKDIGETCMSGFELDLASSKSRFDRLQKAVDLTMMTPEPKSEPWEKAANVNLPIIARACKNFAEMAYDAIINDGNIVKGRVIGDDEAVSVKTPVSGVAVEVRPEGTRQQRADRVATYSNWDLMEGMTEWEAGFDKLTTVLPVYGMVFKKPYYDDVRKKNCSSLRLPHEMIMDYYADSVETCTRITDIYPLNSEKTVSNVRAGIFLDIQMSTGKEEDDNNPEAYAEFGSDFGNDDYEFLEMYTYADLDGDKYPEPYIITLHRKSGKIVRIVPNFLETGIKANDKGDIISIEREYLPIPYTFMPSFDGSIYGTGFAELLLHITTVCNTTVNQLLDSGTLSNLGGGFIGKGMRMKAGEIKMKPAQWLQIPSSGADIRESIVPMVHNPPSQVMMTMLQALLEFANSLNVEVGMDGNMNQQAAATTMAMVDRSQRSFKSVFRRIHRSLKQELKCYYKMNSYYLTDEKYREVINDSEATVEQDFNVNDYDIVPTSDPDVASNMMRLAKAQYLSQFVGNPLVDQKKITLDLLAAGKIDDPEAYIAQPQEPQPTIEQQALLLAQQNEQARLQIEQQKLNMQQAKDAVEIEKTRAQTQNVLADTNSKLVNIDKQQADGLKSLSETAEIMKGSDVSISDIKVLEGVSESDQTGIPRLEDRPENEEVF